MHQVVQVLRLAAGREQRDYGACVVYLSGRFGE